MNIKPLAFESMGTRGMATSVVTRDCIILIDPGVNLAPGGLECLLIPWRRNDVKITGLR